ncbi:MAG: Trk system potassium transporter TrkA [Bacteroidetes bacterium]|nr:Trk system potassium transporter TrkA [Bacteroidota bacterium]
MRAIVIGAGEVGFDVAKLLAKANHDVVVIDVDEDALDHVSEKLDVMVLEGSGTSTKLLEEAGIENAKILVAVTAVDEVNIIACMLAGRLGVETTVARIRSTELSNSDSATHVSEFGITVAIHPEESAAAEVCRLVRRASATDVLPLADGRLHLLGLRLDRNSPVVGRKIKDVMADHPDLHFRVMAIARGIRTILPGGNEEFVRNDQLFVIARPKTIPPMLAVMGISDQKIHDVMVLGGTDIGAMVARELSEDNNIHVKLVEPDRERAEDLAEELSKVLVIHGETTDIDLLITEGLSDMDAFVAVTDDEESNLVTCLLAKHLQIRKTVALLSKPEYIPISQSIGLDAAVNKKLAVSREIMRYFREKHVLSVATVPGMDAEILEIEAAPRSPITCDSLMNLDLPDGMLLAAVMYGKHVDIATGTTEIEPGQRAYVFVLSHLIDEVERLFRSP